MIKTRINNEYKDIIKIFGGSTLQKEITKVWSREANKYVYESSVEYTGTLPITITADGNALLDYKIYGNTEQNGTPTPENPIMPIGCGEMTENLFNAEIEQGSFLPTSGAENPSDYRVRSKFEDDVIPAGTYIIHAAGAERVVLYVYDTTKNFISEQSVAAWQSLPFTFTINDAYYVRFAFSHRDDSAIALTDVYNIMLNHGSTALPYEPYGYKLPILSNSTVTNIYLGEVETTRRIKKLVLTGKEDPNITNSTTESGTKVFSLRFDAIGMTDILDYDAAMDSIQYPFFYSTHFKQKNNRGKYTDIKDGEIGANTVSGEVPTFNRYVIFGTNTYTTVERFKAYLAAQYSAGTPVTVWYVLEEPETGIVNEPSMKIGDYVDTISMEQAGVSIPTFTGTTVIDCDGELKPSQMYIKYRR